MYCAMTQLSTILFFLMTSPFYVLAVQVDSQCAGALHSTQTLLNDARTTLNGFMAMKQNQGIKTRLMGAIKTYSTTDLGILGLLEADDVKPDLRAGWLKGSKEVLAAGKMVTALVKPDGPEASDLVEDLSIADMGLGDVARKCAAQVAQ